MNSRRLVRAAAFVAALMAPALSFAELPYGSLQFDQRVATVGPNDVIDVALTFTLDPDSPALRFSPGDVTAFDADDLPTIGLYWNPETGQDEERSFAEITGANLNTYFVCGTNFTGACISGAPYSFTFWLTSQPGKPSINFIDEFDLAPAASTSFLFGQFVPQAGGANPGTYVFAEAGLTLEFTGLDEDGNYLRASSVTLGRTCSVTGADCAFTRTVVAVPEPESYLMMGVGLAALLGVVRRRRRGA